MASASGVCSQYEIVYVPYLETMFVVSDRNLRLKKEREPNENQMRAAANKAPTTSTVPASATSIWTGSATVGGQEG